MPPALPDQFQPFDQPEFEAASKPKFRWHKFLGCLKKYWWLPLVTLFFAVAVALLVVWFMPPSYTSLASMWETVKLKLPDGSLFSEDTDTFLGTQTEVLQSPTIHDAVLKSLAAKGVKIPLGKDGQPLPVDIVLSQQNKSAVFDLAATGADAAYTKAYLNALMDAYLELKKNVREMVSEDALASITEQVQKTDRDLKYNQEILTNFKRTNNLAILAEEGAAAGQSLINLKTQLSDMQLQDRLLQATMRDASTNSASTNAAAVNSLPVGLDPSSSVSTSYATSYQTLQTLQLERDKLSQYLRPKHPKIVKLDEEIDRTKRLLDVYVRESREELAAERQTLQLKMANIQSSIKEWETNAAQANAMIAQADQLQLNVQRVQDVYDRLMLLVQNVSISRNIDQETLSILQPASDARRSYASEKGVLVKGVVAGLGLGVGLILLLTLRDDRFNTVVEFNERLGDSVIGQVPEVQMMGGKSPLLLEEGASQHMLAESYRNLRSALLFMAVEGARPKVVLITSALPSEGKSTVAANLAQALALSGSRVVLVDCDLRKGVVHERMGLSREPGLTEVLRGKVGLDQAIQTNSVANLSFITRGKSVSDSADLFLGPTFARVISQLREQFDYVLVDSSPVLATDDATTLAPSMDGTLFVVRGNYTGGKQVSEALDQLYQRQAKILGVVFNRANSSASSYHYYKYKEYQTANED
jgi:capsular exopolysaccharide synthesis family protein